MSEDTKKERQKERQKKRPTESTTKNVGSDAFGEASTGASSGAGAFGAGDTKQPLRGALAFGNDPEGKPGGAAAFGGGDSSTPLRGALVFGNDPEGGARGAQSFGGVDAAFKLKGALLFGNDPDGKGRGAASFGSPDQRFPFSGASAFGARQAIPERFLKDILGYDFAAPLLQADSGSMAGIRKSPMDTIRQRVLAILDRSLTLELDRLRHGLGETSIPWGRLKRNKKLDKALAEEARLWFRRAPGEVLGIAQTRDLLVSMGHMHTFSLRAEWDNRPIKLSVYEEDELIASAISTQHKSQSFFVFKNPKGENIAWVDAITPHLRTQSSRIRNREGALVGEIRLVPSSERSSSKIGDAGTKFRAEVLDSSGVEVFRLEEQKVGVRRFVAELRSAEDNSLVGRMDDRLKDGKIRAYIEMDLPLPRLFAWSVAVVMADLARLRRAGWPDAPEDKVEGEIESVEEALGPRRGPRS